ncbi:folate family ECF transporter S component [Lactobacillaceae bacterium L1_55_11]|nr:folate family ECF transporter S component [Lactobacillaceae bacterium L1_55_11]
MEKHSSRGLIPPLSTKSLVVLAVLMAMSIVLGQLTFGTQLVQVSFVSIVTALIGKWYGPVWSILVAMVLDQLKAFLFLGGQNFPAYTVVAAIGGAIYGLAYYGHSHLSWPRVLTTTALITVIVNLTLNSLCIYWMYGGIHNWASFWAFITPRLIKSVIFYPIQVLLTYFILNSTVVTRFSQRIFS